MKTAGTLLAAAAALVDVALGHYRFVSLIVNDTTTDVFEYVRAFNNHNSPVTDLNSMDMRCNVGGLTSGPNTSVATVIAGSTVGFGVEKNIEHPGPVLVYMSQVPSGSTVQTYDASGPWFKINETGAVINSTAITFPAQDLTSYNFTITSTVPPGAYLLRIESIALHNMPAQFYMACAQIEVIGPGGGHPSPTCLIPGLYHTDDPGINIDIYYPIPKNYTIPGPALWTGD